LFLHSILSIPHAIAISRRGRDDISYEIELVDTFHAIMLNSFSNGGATDISTLTPRIKYGTRVLSDTSLVLDVGLKIGTCSSIRKKRSHHHSHNGTTTFSLLRLMFMVIDDYEWGNEVHAREWHDDVDEQMVAEVNDNMPSKQNQV
jgi:hypothetical protein